MSKGKGAPASGEKVKVGGGEKKSREVGGRGDVGVSGGDSGLGGRVGVEVGDAVETKLAENGGGVARVGVGGAGSGGGGHRGDGGNPDDTVRMRRRLRPGVAPRVEMEGDRVKVSKEDPARW